MDNQFILFIKRIIDLPEVEGVKVLKLIKPVRIAKGEYYIREGQVPKKFAFVEKGLFRYLYINYKGTEFTKNFILENNFISAYSAMISQQPSRMFIEALEDSYVYEISYTDWLDLKKGHECWNRFLLAIVEKAFSIKEIRERDLLLLEAQERYDIFKKEFPTLENRIKQHMIASYLGISPISLSRIRSKLMH
ncbi:Crp/Fnr family transcriptional regulator [Emticicia sp. BO119]|uniref:Crp/Fnr family transcriptional regulator n=1 Tax=Emticicia sp. BO119 TaxID=2757768 RepID=UPI0015F0FD0A|nr:Crp/Fnr family transcriptional regulator [Emticicia sp. BO119]MBA4852194.1 Crp/Fnr family transcriptional regulator [Emticicia sp. BO119]